MIIFLAGLQAIPNELYEAAAVDGARRWHRFRYVTLPMLRPTLLFSTVIASIGLLQVFEEPFVMTQGGPLDSTLTVAFHAYNQFSFGNYGYTAAIAYVLFLVIAVLTALSVPVLRPTDLRCPMTTTRRSPQRQSGRRRATDRAAASVVAAPRPHRRLRRDDHAVRVDDPQLVQDDAGAAPGPSRGSPRSRRCRTTGTCSTVSTSRGTSSTRRSSPSRHAGNLLFCSMLGYALAKLQFPGKRALFAVMLATLMVPVFVTFMPLFVIVSNMNLNQHPPA